MIKILKGLNTTTNSKHNMLQHNMDTHNFYVDKTTLSKQILENTSLINKQEDSTSYEFLGRIILNIYRPIRPDQTLSNILNNAKSNEFDLPKFQPLEYSVDLNKSNFPSHIGFR
jgi:TPP-dependent 2-oxoacid decarboxylase